MINWKSVLEDIAYESYTTIEFIKSMLTKIFVISVLINLIVISGAITWFTAKYAWTYWR